MFEITGQGCVEVEVCEQFAGHARIFGGDEADILQDAQGARTQVFQVADRGGDEIKGAHATIKPQMDGEGNRQPGGAYATELKVAMAVQFFVGMGPAQVSMPRLDEAIQGYRHDLNYFSHDLLRLQ